MSGNCQVTTEVIPIEDDEEDVEVVFSTLKKSHVKRNLKYQKISQEIELLQAMSKQIVPNDFGQFKKLAKKLNFNFDDEVIQSAWQRVMKKFFMKCNSLQKNKAPICLVRPIQSPVNTSLPQNPPVAISTPSYKRPSLSTTISQSPVNISLPQTPPVTKYSPSHEGSSLSITISQFPVNISLPQTPPVTISTPSHEGPSMTPTTVSAVPIALLMNQSIQVNSLLHASTECSSNSPKSNRPQELQAVNKNEHRPLASSNANNRVFPLQESACSQTDSVIADSKNYLYSEINSKIKESELDILCMDPNKQGLSKSKHGEEYLNVGVGENSWGGCFSEPFEEYTCDNPKQNQLRANKEVKKKSSQKRKSSVKPVESEHSLETELAVAKSHVGVKAKIFRTKQTTPRNSRKKIIKQMSEAELKEFKVEQKRLKYEQQRELEMQQLQKVHDRLVDVLIPKYYNRTKHLKEKG